MLYGPYLFNATDSILRFRLFAAEIYIRSPTYQISAQCLVASFCLLRFTSNSRLVLIKAIN
jgi:hypothetical protein